MRHTLFCSRGRLLLWLACSVSLVVGCDDERFVNVISQGVFEPGELDFGVGKTGEVYSLPVSLVNVNLGDLQVREVQFTAHSESFAVRGADGNPLRGTAIQNGERVPLSVLFSPNALGDSDTTLRVVFEELAAELNIRAQSVSTLPPLPVVSPQRLDFGVVPIGATATRSLSIANMGEAEGTNLRITLTPPDSAVTFQTQDGSAIDGASVAAGRSVTVVAAYAPTQATALVSSGKVAFSLGGTSSVSVAGSGAPPGTLDCVPISVSFGAVPRDSDSVRTVRCSKLGGPWELSDVELVAPIDPLFSVLGVREGSSMEVDFEFGAVGFAASHAQRALLRASHGASVMLDLSASVSVPSSTQTDTTVRLSWPAGDADVDLHLVRGTSPPFAAGDDCHFRDKHLDWGLLEDSRDDPYLDRDATTGPGAELINLGRAGEARYGVFVQFFRAGVGVNSVDVVVDVYLRGAHVASLPKTISTCGDTWQVGTLQFGTSPATFALLDSLTAAYVDRAECD